jgi:hypothetical protein
MTGSFLGEGINAPLLQGPDQLLFSSGKNFEHHDDGQRQHCIDRAMIGTEGPRSSAQIKSVALASVPMNGASDRSGHAGTVSGRSGLNGGTRPGPAAA